MIRYFLIALIAPAALAFAIGFLAGMKIGEFVEVKK